MVGYDLGFITLHAEFKQDASGKVVARDVKVDPEAVVDFTPSASGRYTVRIRLFDSDNNVPCFCVAVFTHDDSMNPEYLRQKR